MTPLEIMPLLNYLNTAVYHQGHIREVVSLSVDRDVKLSWHSWDVAQTPYIDVYAVLFFFRYIAQLISRGKHKFVTYFNVSFQPMCDFHDHT